MRPASVQAGAGTPGVWTTRGSLAGLAAHEIIAERRAAAVVMCSAIQQPARVGAQPWYSALHALL